MTFPNRETFRNHLAMYAVHNKYSYRHEKTSPDFMIIKCSGKHCPWRIYAVRIDGSEIIEIRRATLQHNCTVEERKNYQRKATTGVIGEMLKTKFGGAGSGPTPKDIKDIMRGDHNVRISYWKAWRSRELAMNSAKGSADNSYVALPAYLEKLVVANPGTIIGLETLYDAKIGERFKYLFCAMGASIKGFAYMRKVIIIDGTHLRGRYTGCLLTASAQDGNYKVFPLAYAIVDSENDLAWEYFFSKLVMFIPNTPEMVFISDRHASIYSALSKIYPDVRHCACIVHLKRNVKSIFKNKHLVSLVSRCAKAYTLGEFYCLFDEIKKMDSACATYLTDMGLDHWARSHFEGERYDVMTSNVAESWNAALKEAREYPIISLVEYIRAKLMTWYADRRKEASDYPETLTPRVCQILAENFYISSGYEVDEIKGLEFEVRDKDGGPFKVNLAKKQCSCYEFQTLKIPCSHAVAAAVTSNQQVDRLCAIEYTTAYWKNTYTETINPATDVNGVTNLNSALSELTLHPPTTRRPPGRPRRKRFYYKGETLMRSLRRRTKCSRCGRLGHNKASCKMPTA